MTLALLLSLTTLTAAQSDTAGDAAVRRTIERHYFAAHDYFILVRSGGDWKIVSKAFQRFPKR